MDIQTVVEILVNLALYIFGGWVFISFVIFVLREVAPKVMSGKMLIREYISLFAGSVLVLFLLAFGPYYLGKALQHGWYHFKPVVVEITSDIAGDITTIVEGNEVVITVPSDPALIPTPIVVIETPVPVVATPTLAPTAPPTPFDFNQWSPDQPVPTPGG